MPTKSAMNSEMSMESKQERGPLPVLPPGAQHRRHSPGKGTAATSVSLDIGLLLGNSSQHKFEQVCYDK